MSIGSPDENDTVARAERIAQSVLDRAIPMGKRMRETMEREFGSQKKDEVAHYLSMKDNIDLMDRRLQMEEERIGVDRAQAAYAEWIQKMDRRVNRGS